MLNIPFTCTAPYSKLSEQVHNLVDPPQRVFFSMFRELESPSTPDSFQIVSYPDLSSPTPIISGNVTLLIDDHDINPTPVFSPVLVDPSWKDILQTINDMFKNTATQIGFLENIVPHDAGVYQVFFSH